MDSDEYRMSEEEEDSVSEEEDYYISEEEEDERPDSNYGIQTTYTQSEFDDHIAEQDINCQCELKGYGTLYFVYGKNSGFSDFPRQRQVHAVHYEKERGIMHKSADFLINASTPFKVLAMDRNSFIFTDRYNCLLCVLDGAWSTATFTDMSPGRRLELAEFLSNQTSVNRNGLHNIRRGCPADFSIKCAGSKAIGVQKAVLSSTWPFFKAMLETNMKEASINVLELDMPKSTVKAIIKYLYGEKLTLETEDAARLLVAAQMYELPELVELAEDSLKNDRYCEGAFDFHEALMIWKKAYEAGNDHLRDFAANEIKDLMPGMNSFADEVDELSKEELMFLMQDVSVCMGKKRMHV